MRSFFVAAALTCALAGQSSAQNDHGDANVTITGNRAEEIARAFIGEVSQSPAHRRQLARWDGRVCAGVVGLNAEQGQFVADRISQRAHDVGLIPGDSGCKANLVIVFTADARGLAQALAEHEGLLLGLRGRPQFLTTRGVDLLDDFVATTRPVRWWHVAHTTTQDGQPIHEPKPGLRGRDEAPMLSVRGTRTSATTREDFRNAIIIVDTTQLNGLSVEPLADYLAMVSLAQLSPDADMTPYDSILNLFGSSSRSIDHMTDWDLAYLQGLYHAIRNPNTLPYQERQMAQHMTGAMEATVQPQPSER